MRASTPSFLQQRLEFSFPAAEVQAGVPLSNGSFGAVAWGESGTLRLTLGRAHGEESSPVEPSPEELREWVAQQDAARLRSHFSQPSPPDDEFRLPLGRVDLELGPDWKLLGGGLHLLTGELELEVEGRRTAGKLRGAVLRDYPVFCLRGVGVESGGVQVRSRPPDSREVREHLRARRLPEPQPFDYGEFGGWVQEFPGSAATCVGWLRPTAEGGLLFYLTTVDAETPAEARKAALQTLDGARSAGYTPSTLRTFSGWRKWWAQAAEVSLPDPALALAYCLWMYRLGGAPQIERSPAELSRSPWTDLDAALSATETGELCITIAGRGSATLPLRPPWLDGKALMGQDRTLKNGRMGYW
jgi:hypothetical protein